MNFFEILNKEEYKNTPIAIQNGEIYSISEIKSLILPLYKELLKNPNKKVLITSNNHFDFFIKFISAVLAKKELYFLPDLRRIELLNFEYNHLTQNDFSKTQKTEIKNSNENIDTNIDFEKTFLNLYTSGSTGTPKCVTKTLQNLIIEATDIFEEYKNDITQKPTAIATSTTPHHMFCMSFYIILPLCYVGKILFDAQEILYPDDCNLEDKIFISTPSFLEKFKKYEISLNTPPRIIMTAGDKLKDDIFEYFYNKNIPLKEIYGSSEVGVVAYKTKPYEEIFNCYKNITIETDKESKILVHSPFYTGDNYVLGDYIDLIDNKHFILKSRSDRILKIQEKRISAIELENFVKESQFINDAYCLKYGEKLACATVLNEKGQDEYLKNSTKLVKDIKAFLKQKSEIIPQKWRFLNEIPKTQTGKTDIEKIKSFFAINLSLPIVKETKHNLNEASLKLIFPYSCNFFDGHFKDFPILPGVVQLYLAHMYAQNLFNISIPTKTVKKMKFSHIIKPNENIELNLKKSDNNVTYTYKFGEKICSSGVFSVDKKE